MDGMLITIVDISVKPEHVEDFLRASIDNATASLAEPGVVRFDVLQDPDDPTHAVLIEVYVDADGPVAHRQTEHYATWRDIAEPMMARPRTRQLFTPVFPAQERDWRSAG
jgi:autoinducer 2-degrading protein